MRVDRATPCRTHSSELPALLARSSHELRRADKEDDVRPSCSVISVVLLAGLAVFVMGGIVPGLNSLYGVLYSEGVFRSHCGAERAHQCEVDLRNRSHHEPISPCCDEQDAMLTLLSSVALFASDGVMLLYGELLDRRGARVCCAVALGFSWFGFGLLAMNAAHLFDHLANGDGAWMLAFFCIGVAGPGIFMSCTPLRACAVAPKCKLRATPRYPRDPRCPPTTPAAPSRAPDACDAPPTNARSHARPHARSHAPSAMRLSCLRPPSPPQRPTTPSPAPLAAPLAAPLPAPSWPCPPPRRRPLLRRVPPAAPPPHHRPRRLNVGLLLRCLPPLPRPLL
jgi:hypothetical protein